jgi:hypothetical protein
MGVDSKGICLTKNKDVFNICKQVEKALDNLVGIYKNPKVRVDKENLMKSVEINPMCEMVIFHFYIKGEQRSLHLHFGCDSDYREEGLLGSKLIFSVGMWGMYEEIIYSVADALLDHGPVFTKLNDCDSSPFVKHSNTEFMRG